MECASISVMNKLSIPRKSISSLDIENLYLEPGWGHTVVCWELAAQSPSSSVSSDIEVGIWGNIYTIKMNECFSEGFPPTHTHQRTGC